MALDSLTSAFVAAVAIHNFEEALWLPKWSRSAGRFHPPVGAIEFRFAAVVLTALAVACAVAAAAGSVVGIYLACGYALAMALNAFVPHAAATIALRRYMPGTATGLALNLPICSRLVYVAFRDGQIAGRTFLWVAPLVVIAIVALIPLLFLIGRSISPGRCRWRSLPRDVRPKRKPLTPRPH